MNLLRKLFRAIGIFLYVIDRWCENSRWGYKLAVFWIDLTIFADLYAIERLFPINNNYIFFSIFIALTIGGGLFTLIFNLEKKYKGTKYDTEQYRRTFIRRLFVFCGIFFVVCLGAAHINDRITSEQIDRIILSFDYEGTERDSIAAVSVLGTVDTLLEKRARSKSVGFVEVVKFGVLTRARRFDEARKYVSETDFAKDLDAPGYNDYLNLRIDFLENRARGNAEALKASARKMHDYLLKQVALPEFEMDSVLRYGLSADKRFAMRTYQFRMLKALTVCFKEPADTAELADRLRSLYPATEYQSRLTRMPDRAEAEKIVYSALPH